MSHPTPEQIAGNRPLRCGCEERMLVVREEITRIAACRRVLASCVGCAWSMCVQIDADGQARQTDLRADTPITPLAEAEAQKEPRARRAATKFIDRQPRCMVVGCCASPACVTEPNQPRLCHRHLAGWRYADRPQGDQLKLWLDVMGDCMLAEEETP